MSNAQMHKILVIGALGFAAYMAWSWYTAHGKATTQKKSATHGGQLRAHTISTEWDNPFPKASANWYAAS